VFSRVSGKIRILNLTQEPQTLQRNRHFCKIRATVLTDKDQRENTSANNYESPIKTAANVSSHSNKVRLDPDNLLTNEMKAKFRGVLEEYDDVFNPNFKGCNGAVGPFQAKVTMGPVQPPQRKERVPQYSRNQLVEI